MKNKPTIGIIGGSGKMGQWFKHFFESNGLKVFIAGRNTNLSLESLVKKSDIIIVSTPISQTIKVIKTVVPLIKKDSLLCDISSLKEEISKEMKNYNCAYLGMHPLFGPSINISAGKQIVFCRQKENKYVDVLKNIFERARICVIEISPKEHDIQMAYIQALTHTMNLLFAKSILEENKISANLQTPTFTLQSLVMGRIFQQDLKLTSEIISYNPYFPKVLEMFLENGEKILKKISENKIDEIIKIFSEDQKLAKNFANLSSFKTNKILEQISVIPTTLPKKIEVKSSSKMEKIAYLGPQGTYSHIAACLVFPHYKNVSSGTIFEIFNKVSTGDADLGIVPAENSIEGTVKGTFDYLVDFSLNVIGSFELPIHHQLLSIEKNIKNINTIVSHPQALSQCQNWIRKNIPNAKINSSLSTASEIKKQKGFGYIGSKAAGDKFRIDILAKNIEDNKNNSTRFYVISKNTFEIKELNNNKTLIFITVYNRVGILRDILDLLASHDLNLSKLESRPSREKIWDYHFFIEIEKKYNDPSLACALKALEVFCPMIKVLGQT